MFMNSVSRTSRMPPRRDIPLQPILEKRRIIGSLRERTVYVQSPQTSSQNYQVDDIDHPLSQYSNEMIQQLLGNLTSRINDHIERTLAEQQISIDSKIAEIDEQVNANMAFQANLEQQLKDIKKTVKQKVHSHSQPIETQRSSLSLMQPFPSTQDQFQNNQSYGEIGSYSACTNPNVWNCTSDEFETPTQAATTQKSIYTTLW